MADDALSHPTDAASIVHAFVEAATTAGYAPSIHNTQPWRWRLNGNALSLSTERCRVLEVTDPDARLARLSCGVALHHARISLAAHGWHVEVTRMPQDGDPDFLARLRIEGRAPVDKPSVLHLRTIPLRLTDRRPVTGPPAEPKALASVTAAVEVEGTWLHTLPADQVLDLAGASDRAQRAQAKGTAWQTQLAHWTGGTRPTGTGIPDGAIPAGAAQTTVRGRDFGHYGDLLISAEHDAAAVFTMLCGRGDEPIDWLRAGEALSAGWLTATEHGVSVVPHSAPIEVVATRQAMRTILAGIGYPYLLLRLGTVDPADPAPPYAPRQPTEQIIERGS